MKRISDSPARASQFRSELAAAGGKLIAQYWALGDVDGFIVFEMPDDASATALLLNLGKLGNVRTHSVRIFDESEFNAILGKC